MTHSDAQNRNQPYRWRAQWLQDPRFAGLKPINTFYRWKDVDPYYRTAPHIFAEHRPGLSNVHMRLRKAFTLPRAPRQALLRITADDHYKLWVNGHFVGEGPPSAYHWHYYYDTWDIAPWLAAGENVIAAHVYYQGLITRVWVSLDHRMGLVAEADIVLDDGGAIRVWSDASWKYRLLGKETTVTLDEHRVRRSPEHYYRPPHSGGMIGSLTQWQENIDEREREPGWHRPGFDDSHWHTPAAVEVPTDYVFYPTPTPLLAYRTLRPVRIEALAPNRYLLDFGRETVGTFGLRQPGRDGHVIEIRHAEELTPEGAARYQMRCNCDYQEFWTLADRDTCTLEYYDYKGFRYVEVVDPVEPPTPETAWVTERHYPWPEGIRFECSLPLLQDIWDLCAHTTRLGAQSNYIDCPQREKGHNLVDMACFAPLHVLLTGDGRLLRQSLQQFAQSARITPALKFLATGNFMLEAIDASLVFPTAVENYYTLTGDLSLVEEAMPAIDGMLAFFRQYATATGLIGDVPGLLHHIDHPPAMMADYDFEWIKETKQPAPGTGPYTVLNAYYVGACETAERLRSRLSAQPASTTALRDALVAAFFRPDLGVFVDRIGSDHASSHANAMALFFDLVPAEAVPSVVAHLRQRGLAGSPWLAAYLLPALCRHGAVEAAFDFVTSRARNSWFNMLQSGATALMEVWDVSLKRNISFCHPWAASPIGVIVQHVMGLQPLRPGWEGVRFSPYAPPELAEAELSICLPQGPACVRLCQSASQTAYVLNLPPGVRVEADPASGYALAAHDPAAGQFTFTRQPAAQHSEAALRS